MLNLLKKSLDFFAAIKYNCLIIFASGYCFKMAYKEDARVKKTKNKLLESFKKLLSEKSFENITIQEICELADVKRATFYKHFADKYGMNREVVYPHSFRHRFAKNFLDRFNDLALLADLMGHESIETTRIYLRRTASEQQKIVDKVVNW